MLFSYNKNVNFPDISVGKNAINETSVAKFLGIHIDKKFNFINHITEMSMKVAKSIGLLYKLNRFLPETILKTLYTSLIPPYLSYGIEAWHGTYQNNTSKSLFSRRMPYVLSCLALNRMYFHLLVSHYYCFILLSNSM